MADSACEHAAVAGGFSFKTMEETINFGSKCDLSLSESMVETQRQPNRALRHLLCDGGQAQRQLSSQHSDERANVMEEKNRRRADRYDSSESSDSGVASLTCSDASSWSSSSDITEPVSPASPESQSTSPPLAAVAEVRIPTPASTVSLTSVSSADSVIFASSSVPGAGAPGEARKRSRRHSDSSCRPCKRARRLSGPSHASTPLPDQFPPKWLEYYSRHLAADSGIKRECHLAGESATKVKVGTLSATKGGVQTKITHFFKTQVKHFSHSHVKSSFRESVTQQLTPSPSVSPPSDILTPTTPSSPQQQQQIRFPATVPHKSNSASSCVTVCLWKDCGLSLTTNHGLLDHIQTVHVTVQARRSETCSSGTSEKFACHWEGCKVAGRCSSSRAWLERHVLCHVGSKPFRCIVESCGQRFGSQAALERHVNAHFNQETNSQTAAGSNGIGRKDFVQPKLMRRNSKKLRNRRKQVSARLFDVFDAGIMERLRHQLFKATECQSSVGLSSGDQSVTVHSKVLARRVDADGTTKVLLTWTPKDILPDEWVHLSEASPTRRVPVRSLSPSAQSRVLGIASSSSTDSRRKNRRKP